MCPSSGSPALSGGSRFTFAPTARRPSVVTASVAADTSAVKLARRRGDRREADAVDGDAAADGERRGGGAAELDYEPRVAARSSCAHATRPMPFTNPENTSFSLPPAQAPATLLAPAVARKSPPKGAADAFLP